MHCLFNTTKFINVGRISRFEAVRDTFDTDVGLAAHGGLGLIAAVTSAAAHVLHELLFLTLLRHETLLCRFQLLPSLMPATSRHVQRHTNRLVDFDQNWAV